MAQWGELHVALWDKVAKRRIPSTAYKGELVAYLAQNPHLEVYNRQDGAAALRPGGQLLAGQRVSTELGESGELKVVLWDTHRQCKVPPEECPTQAGLAAYMRSNPHLAIFESQKPSPSAAPAPEAPPVEPEQPLKPVNVNATGDCNVLGKRPLSVEAPERADAEAAPEAKQSKPPVVEWQRTEIATPAVLPTGPAKPGNKRPCFSLSNSKPLVPQLSFGTPTCTPNASLSPPQGLPLGKPLPVPSCRHLIPTALTTATATPPPSLI